MWANFSKLVFGLLDLQVLGRPSNENENCFPKVQTIPYKLSAAIEVLYVHLLDIGL